MLTSCTLTYKGQIYDLKRMIVNHGLLATRKFISNELGDSFPTPVWTKTIYDFEDSSITCNEFWLTMSGLGDHLASVAADILLRQGTANKASVS